jgi:ABC-2 type transport system ATP-binding protein
MSHAVVLLEGVTKHFTEHRAVDALSLGVREGIVYGLLGPNGAGKTTTIRMIVRILLPDAGRVVLFGQEASRDLSHLIGYLPEERGLYRKMRVLEVLVFLAEARGIRHSEAEQRSRKWLQRMHLEDWTNRRVEELSKGMQQKVQFIGTVLHDPRLIVLDEPFAGLDPVNVQVLKDTVVELKRGGTTVLFSTHVMEQAEKVCDEVCIMVGGRKVAEGGIADVKRGHGGRHVVVGFEAGGDAVPPVFRDRRIVAHVDDYGSYAEVELGPEVQPHELLAELVAGGARLRRFEVAEPTLHKVFVDLAGGDGGVGRGEG